MATKKTISDPTPKAKPTTTPTPKAKTIKMETSNTTANMNLATLETEVAQLRQVNTNAIAIANFAFGKLNEI